MTLTSSSSHINVHELEALLVLFNTWAGLWHYSKIIIYTDNTTAFNGLVKFRLRGLGKKTL